MAVALHVYIKNKHALDTEGISVEHVFYGKNEEEADKIRLAHLAGCENFALAEAEGRTAEAVEDDTDAPTFAEVNDADDVGDDEEEEDEEEEGDDGGDD